MCLFSKRVDDFAYFRDAAANAATVARLLKDLFSGQADLVQTAERMRDLVHQGNAEVRTVLLAQNSSAFAPISDQDVRSLTQQFDDFLDSIDAVGQRFVLYKPLPTTEQAQLLVGIINAQADLLAEAVAILKHQELDDELAQHIGNLRRLKHEADAAWHEALLSLFDDITEIPMFVHAKHWEELYSMLNESTECAEKITNVFLDIMERRQ